MRRRLLRIASALIGVVVGVTVALVVIRPADPSAVFFPTAKRIVNPDLHLTNGLTNQTKNTAQAPSAHLPHGPIYRPNPSLTPGAVEVTDTRAVCAGSRHPHVTIPLNVEDQVFNMYKVPPTMDARDRRQLYGFDYLVPLELGGAPVISNLWPVPKTNRGLGYKQKEILNIRMHVLVCHNELPLATAQQQMESDWVTLWTRYGVSTSLYN